MVDGKWYIVGFRIGWNQEKPSNDMRQVREPESNNRVFAHFHRASDSCDWSIVIHFDYYQLTKARTVTEWYKYSQYKKVVKWHTFRKSLGFSNSEIGIFKCIVMRVQKHLRSEVFCSEPIRLPWCFSAWGEATEHIRPLLEPQRGSGHHYEVPLNRDRVPPNSVIVVTREVIGDTTLPPPHYIRTKK